MPSRKKKTLAFLLAMVCGCAYIATYSVLMPLLEKHCYDYMVKPLVEPVEAIRASSPLFYWMTESLYDICGGTQYPLTRIPVCHVRMRREFRFGSGPFDVRYIATTYGDGRVYTETICNNRLRYPAERTMRGEILNGLDLDERTNSLVWIANGLPLYAETRDRKGQVVARAVYREGVPDEGTMYDDRAGGFVQYRNGKPVGFTKAPYEKWAPPENQAGLGHFGSPPH